MRRNRGGYTIVEVLIVLAVGGVLLGGAIVAFQGQQGRTVFSQTLYDLASKIQSYAGDVSSGVYDDANNYGCVVNPPAMTPVLTAGGSSNSGCLFLGKAVQIPQNGTKMYSYTVLGDRVDASNNQVTKFDNAKPEPAQDATGNWLLTDEYELPAGMKFTTSAVKDIAGTSSNAFMVGLYIDLSGETSAGGSTALSVRGYRLNAFAPPSSPAVKTCIEQGAPCNLPVMARNWKICIQDGSVIGSINVESGSGGVTTRVNSLQCS